MALWNSRFWLVFVAVAGIAGCAGDTGFNLPDPVAEQAPFTNGYPSVVQVFNGGVCSGVIVHPHVVLTAAHCLKRAADTVINVGGARFRTSNKASHGTGAKGDPFDVGILYFNEDVSGGVADRVVPIGDRISAGTTVRLVGFGCGGKRTGTNVVYRIGPFIELLATTPPAPRRITGPANRAETCPGDSGSPALVEGPTGTRVVGVLHGEARAATQKFSVYVNLTQPDNREFLRQRFQDMSLPFP